MNAPRVHAPSPAPSAYTFVELLSVIAIIGILTAIVIPSVASSRTAANKARSKMQFHAWSAAFESFRSEYGYYPTLDDSNLVNGGATATEHPFHDVLAGRKRDGSALSAGSPAATQNRKAISFYLFSESDFVPPDSTTPGLLRDACGNTEIAVLADRNLDGVIDASDYGASLPAVGGMQPSAADFPAAGIRASVIFYSPTPGAAPDDPQFIFSWK